MFNITQQNYQAPQGFNVPQGWNAVDNNSNNVFRSQLGFGRKRDTPNQTGAWWAGQGQISPEDIAANSTYNQGQDAAFAAKYPSQQMVSRQLGKNLTEYGLLDQSGNISNNWQFKNDDSLDWMENTVPALAMGSLAAMAGAGLSGWDPSTMFTAAAPESASAGLGSLATNPALIESAAGTAGYGASSAGAGGFNGLGSLFSGITSNPVVNQIGKKMTGNIVGNLIGNVLGGGQGNGGVSTLGNLASLFSNYNQYSQNKDVLDQIKGIYSPTGPYAQYLQNELGRKDAAAGRNSQYGPRLAQMLGMLGEGQARALQGTSPFLSGSQGGMNGMLGAGSRLLQGSSLSDWITQALNGNSGGGMMVGELGNTPSLWDRASDNTDWESLFGG